MRGQSIFRMLSILDGFHIRGLLLGFFERYLPEYKDRLAMLQTPVIGVKKNNVLVRWSYNLSDNLEVKSGEVSKYFKGLGSHKETDLKHVVKIDGLEKMITHIDFDSSEIVDDWLSDSKSDKRKEYLLLNDFNIAKI